MEGNLVAISQGSLIQRLNRALAHNGEFLRKTSPRKVPQLGTYFVADIASNLVVRDNVNLEQLLRKVYSLFGKRSKRAKAESRQSVSVDATSGLAVLN